MWSITLLLLISSLFALQNQDNHLITALAHESQIIQVAPALQLQQQELEKYVFSSGTSRLDPLISPETIQKMIRFVIARIPTDPNQNMHRTSLKHAQKLLGKKNKGFIPTSIEAAQA
jgi:hypothetical protein